ncbi:MAG: glycoside hydrolase family 31 protein [Collinsella sp.]|nr:glycoside hydrolase family 31 protein [Collinsella sp.]
MGFNGFNLFKTGSGGSPVKGALAAAAVTFAIASPFAAPVPVFGATYSGALKTVEAAAPAAADSNVVDITFNDDVHGRITFLDNGIFRYNVDPKGEFSEYAAPRGRDHTAKIPAQPDSSSAYEHPKATVTETATAFEIKAGDVTVILDKATAKLSVKSGAKTVMREASPLTIGKDATVQKLEKGSGENYFGGGTQNGRFIHTGQSIDIVNNNKYVDGGVSSPNPFYWSSGGYGVVRNTFAQGSYDFGKSEGGIVSASHSDAEFDAYYFVTDKDGYSPVAQDLLQDYFKVTGNPVLLPEYAFYLGHYNAYNRDMWSATQKPGYGNWKVWGHSAAGGTPEVSRFEKGGTGTKMEAGSLVETLNGTPATVSTDKIPEGVTTSEEFSARGRVDEYLGYDMPLGYFLPNDGYGAGYGQNGYNMTGGVNADGSSSAERLAAVAANVDNLKQFTDYIGDKGVATGLWTQSNLSPDSNPNSLWHTLRDFDAEVKTGGVTTLKTDVAWVGSGYSFGLNGTKTAYDIVTTSEGTTGTRPNIVTLDGWAGSQRFAGIWTGDQVGGNWEYIRFHIPTFIGQSLSGNPNIGSDMDGIWGGNPVIATRDYQWKSFAPLMLDMDGWGSYAKMPYTYGDPYTGINRMYLKLKSSLMPYIYTTAASAANIDTGNGDTGLPFVRAILLSEDSAYAASTATQYEYTMGGDILVAPIYQNTDGDAANGKVGDGNDVRNNIYLPGGEDTVWIDYFSGKQYRGGQVLNNFDAPLWKLPVFVKANAIIPMYEPNANPKNIDRTKRIVEFYATSGSGDYTLYEDTGTFIENNIDESDAAYGRQDNISYGDHVTTKFTSQADGTKATFTAEASSGSYTGYDSNRTSTFVVNVSAEPTSVEAKNGAGALTIKKVATQAEFDATEPAAGEAVYLYNEAPNRNYNATAADEAVRNEGFSSTAITTTPKLSVKFAKTDVAAAAQTLTLEGFVNDGKLPANGLNESLGTPADLAAPEDGKTPTSIGLTWGAVDGATSYELEVDGAIFAMGDAVSYNHQDLAYNSTHTYRVRARNKDGYSAWSEQLTTASLQDPWRNVPAPAHIDWAYGDSWGKIADAFDHNRDSMFHSSEGNTVGKPMTIDYGKVFQLDRFVYTPRQDNGGNGNVAKMKVETSIDGVHWQEHDAGTWDNAGEGKLAEKTVDLTGTVARYLRLTNEQSRGGFFSAGELALYKKDGTNGFDAGAVTFGATVGDADYQHLKGNMLGRENREPMVDQFHTHVSTHGADFNLNDAYDVYDMAFTMSKLDGGTKKTDKVAGGLAVVPSKTEAKAGDIITVDLYADDAKNVNALGALVHYKSAQFEFVDGSIQQDVKIAGMENLSVAQGGFNDGVQSVNLAFANRGDQALCSGTGVVASFKIRAVADGPVDLTSTAWLVGPTMDFKEAVNDGTISFPEVPSSTPAEYGQGAFDITMTNDVLTTDDGGNGAKLLQNANTYAPLFDGDEETLQFEFKWDIANNHVDGALPAYVKLPTTMHFAFKTPSVLDNVEVMNRKGSNGTVTSLEAKITFEDGTTQEFKGGDLAARQDVYTLAVADANKGKKVTKVDITPLTSAGTATGSNPSNRMLTLREINFNYMTAEATVDSVTLGDNATSIYVDDLTPVKATVSTPDDAYPHFTVTSSDESVAGIAAVQSGDGVSYFVRGNKPGTATITVASVLDPTKTASYEVEVKEGVDTSGLLAAIQKAKALGKDAYTAETYEKLASAVSEAEELLKGDGYTKAQVGDAQLKIEDALAKLKMRPVDPEHLINTSAETDVKVVGASSEADFEDNVKGNVLDYQEGTLWHSDYLKSVGMPQWLVFDLGDTYDLTDVTFLPRQGATNGDIFEAEVYVADSAEAFEAAAGGVADRAADAAAVRKLGTFTFDNNGRMLNDRTEFKQMSFGAAPARFVKLNITHAGGDNGTDRYASLSEIRFYGLKHEEPALDVDKAALAELVEGIKAEALAADDYTAATWTPFANALADAERLLADDNATQDEIDQTVASLDAAHKGLVKTEVPPVEEPSKKELEDLVAQARKIDTASKTADSAKALADAIAYAEAVIGDENASAASIQAAYDQLKLAIDGLKDADDGQQPGGGDGDGGTGNGGTGNQGGNDGAGNGAGGQGGSGNAGTGSGSTGGKGSGKGKGGKSLPKTGDETVAIVLGGAAAGGLAIGSSALIRRRKRADQQ